MNFLDSFNVTQNYTALDVVLNLILAFVLGLVVSFVYRLTNRHRALSQSLLMTIIILSMVVALVMMVIGNSIARAFSLVGALSIIRFRTVVKDNRDIAFVFFALVAGMSAGVGNYPIAIFGVVTISLLLIILDYIQFGIARKGIYLLRFQIIPTDTDDATYQTVFERWLSSFSRLSIKTVRMGQFVEHSYLIRLKRGVSEQTFIAELSALEGMERVIILAEESEGEV
ncbi:MAG: DUF4956 domain-containing protein [Candidatus Hatepunaea meridiana]|nr:DUF4956 domain-containing protein [Candidatus Hatepunaea meridiana]